MARTKVDNKLNVVIGTKAQIEGDTSIPENSIIVVTDEEIQDKLIAGDNITIDENNVISASGSGGGGIPEAPEDDKLYGRKNAAWSEIISGGGGTVDWQNVENKPELQDKLTAGANITINPITNVISASGSGGGGELDPNEMAYFNYANSIYGDKYGLLVSAWEHSLTVDPLEISADSVHSNRRGTAQYPNGETEGVIIPRSVTSIGLGAFHGWRLNNQPLVIPNSVTSIGDRAFWEWSANNQPVTIPSSVATIGNNAFERWSSAKEFIMESETPPTIGTSVFAHSNDAPIYVPDDSVEAYKTATNWASLSSRIFPISNRGKEEEIGVITNNVIDIPITEVLTQTQTTIAVVYNYVGDDPVNFTADFSNFALGGGLSLEMPDIGPIPINMVVQTVFGKTTLNYFEIIILFRYIITATLVGAITHGSSRPDLILRRYDEDYRNFLTDVFEGINVVNMNEHDVFTSTFTVDFMMACQDIPFYNTVTGRGSNLGATVETVGDIDATPLIYTGVASGYLSDAWNYLKQSNDLSGYTLYHIQYIGGMTLKLFPWIKMKVNYNGGMYLD